MNVASGQTAEAAIVPYDPAVALPEKAHPRDLSSCFADEESIEAIITQCRPDFSRVCCKPVVAKEAQESDHVGSLVSPVFFRAFYNRGKSFLQDERVCSFVQAEAEFQKASSQVALHLWKLFGSEAPSVGGGAKLMW